MTEATVPFSDHNLIRTLFGARDEYLRQVRQTLGIDVVLRGDEIRLKGEEEPVRQGVTVLQELREIVESRGQLTDEDVRRVLDRQNGALPPQAADLQISAGKVRPRSEGQFHYVRSIDQNDLIFCVGPAGCGKTYLAVAMAISALRNEQVRKIVLVRPAVEAGEKLG